MKILLVEPSDRQMTGLTRYSRTLRQKLIDLGITVGVAHPETPLASISVPIGKKLGWDLPTFFGNYPIKMQPDVADLYHLTAENLSTLTNFRSIDPAIVTVHAFFTYFLRNEANMDVYNHFVHKWFDQLAIRGLRNCQGIIAVSEYVKGKMTDDLGLSPENIFVVPEAVDHEFFRVTHVPPSFRQKYSISNNNINLLYVGSEQPRKNFLTLLRAFARLRSQFPNVRLLKVGQAELESERKKALNLINHLGLEDSVYFLGHVGKDLPFLYNISDIFVFPSLYEGFGFPPLEAMACGTPVICSNTTSLPEVVGEAAMCFDPSNEDQLVKMMLLMVQDQNLRSEYRRLGLVHVQQFSWTKTAEQTIAVYEEVLAGSNRKVVN